jgi:integrase
MTSIRKRDGRPKPYEAVYRDPDGRQRTKAFARKVDARRFLTTVEADQLRGTYVDPHERTTFGEYAREWLERQTTSPATRRGTSSRLNARILPAFGDVELRHIRPSTVQQWLAALQRDGLAASTVRLYLTTVSQVLAAAVDDGLLVRNPIESRSVKPPAKPDERVDAWTAEQVETVIDVLPAHYRGIAVVAAGCGLRQGEAFGLPTANVEWLRHNVHVGQQLRADGTLGPPKGGRVRDVPLPEHVALELSAHLEQHGAGPEGLLFGEPDGGPVDRTRFGRAWRAALPATGLAVTRANGMHALRHFYASALLADGVSVPAVADWLGHADGGALLLRVYGHVMPSVADRGRAVIDRMLGSREPDVSQEGEG